MSPITTHVLDTAQGKPAKGIEAVLETLPEGQGHWTTLGKGVTNADGRITDLLDKNTRLEPGVYRLRFDTAAYFSAAGVNGFYPFIHITFTLADPGQHYHVPLLLSPYGYSTYRGS